MKRIIRKEAMERIYNICKKLPTTGMTSREVAIADPKLSYILFAHGYDIFTAGEYIAYLIRNGMRKELLPQYPQMAYVRSMYVKRGKRGAERKQKAWIKIPPGDPKWKKYQKEYDRKARGHFDHALGTEKPAKLKAPMDETIDAVIDSGKIETKDIDEKKKPKKKVKAK